MSFKVRQRTPQEPSGSLLVGWPKGFDEAGRHVLNDVGEFMLVEKWYSGGPQVVEYSHEVQAAFDQSFFCVSDARDGATKPRDRVMLSSAIYDVYIEARDGSNHAGGSQKALETLGKTFLKAMQAQDVECAIETCAATIKAALRSVAVASGALHGKRSQRKLKPEAVAILEGHRIFLATGERPTKSAIREAMERQRIAFDKKHARARWREVFARARLQNLPD